MKAYHYIVLAGAIVLALPILVTPQGWIMAAVLIGGWVVVTLGGRWIASEYLDLKKQREQGMRTKQVTDKLGGLDDDERYRR